jgi:hypothetical protein
MAQAEVIETFIGCDDAYLSTAVTEVFVGENADDFNLKNHFICKSKG